MGSRPRLDRGLGVGHRRGWRRIVAALDERTMAAHKRMVRAVFRPVGLSRNCMVGKEIRRHPALWLCSPCRCRFLLRRRENCFGNRKLIERLSPIEIQTEPLPQIPILNTPLVTLVFPLYGFPWRVLSPRFTSSLWARGFVSLAVRA
jgi:hypothetical protein